MEDSGCMWFPWDLNSSQWSINHNAGWLISLAVHKKQKEKMTMLRKKSNWKICKPAFLVLQNQQQEETHAWTKHSTQHFLTSHSFLLIWYILALNLLFLSSCLICVCVIFFKWELCLRKLHFGSGLSCLASFAEFSRCIIRMWSNEWQWHLFVTAAKKDHLYRRG